MPAHWDSDEDDEEWEGYDGDPEYRESVIQERREEKLDGWKAITAPIPQDVWSKSREEFPYFDEILKHDFNDMVVVFGINHVYNSNETDIKYEILSQEYDHILLGDYTLKGNVNIAKEIVGNIINHYAPPDTAPRDERYIDGYLRQQVELYNEEVDENEIVKKDDPKLNDLPPHLDKNKLIGTYGSYRDENEKEYFMSENLDDDPIKEETFKTLFIQRYTVLNALETEILSCLPGEDGFTDTKPVLDLVNGVFQSANILYLKEHQKQNDFPTAEYLTEENIKDANKDCPDISIREDQKEKPVSICYESRNFFTHELQLESLRLFNVAQTTSPEQMKTWCEQKQQEKQQEYLDFMKKEYGLNYQLPQPEQKYLKLIIECTSTEPEI
jgi:hypothetical protein